jgi:hypothetical protein
VSKSVANPLSDKYGRLAVSGAFSRIIVIFHESLTLSIGVVPDRVTSCS